MLCGLPCSGKTTWVKNHIETHPEKMYNVIGIEFVINRMKVNKKSISSIGMLLHGSNTPFRRSGRQRTDSELLQRRSRHVGGKMYAMRESFDRLGVDSLAKLYLGSGTL